MKTLLGTRAQQSATDDGESLPFVAGVNHRLISTPRLRTHVAEAGEGTTVLLVHGWLQHWYSWRHVLPLLAEHHRVLAPDLRGFGWSEATSCGYTTAEMADDLIALLDTLGVHDVFVVGHELGGRIGFHLALRYPERARALVAVNALHPYWSTGRIARQAWRQWWTPLVETPLVGRTVLRRLPVFARTFFRSGHPNRETLDDLAVRRYIATVRRPGHARAAERVQSNFAYRELIPTLLGKYRSTRLVTPTLMLNGTRDFAMGASAIGGYEQYADNLRVELVAGGGHFLPEEQPELVAERTLMFFRRHPYAECRDATPIR